MVDVYKNCPEYENESYILRMSLSRGEMFLRDRRQKR